jgi:hypothetical protein
MYRLNETSGRLWPNFDTSSLYEPISFGFFLRVPILVQALWILQS